MAISLGALIFCEVLLGIPGLILAIPIVLFIRHEFEHIRGFPQISPEDAGESAKDWIGEKLEQTTRPASKTR
jgi:predicted PurR-regulated permease PerM